MHNAARRPDAAPKWAREDGMTIVEVMAAIVVFTIGVLGTLSLLENSIASTSQTTAREQGTNLARDLVERTREVSYADTDYSKSAPTLRGKLPASDNVGSLTNNSTFNVTRRNVTYSVTVTSCSIDDPTDGAGVGGTGSTIFCSDTDGSSSGPGSDPLVPAVNVTSVLGIPITVTAGGSLVDAVCKAAALNSVVGTQVLNLLKPVAPISACPGVADTTIAFDAQPDDLRYVRVDVSWTRGGKAGSVSQTTLLTNPRQT